MEKAEEEEIKKLARSELAKKASQAAVKNRAENKRLADQMRQQLAIEQK